MTDQQRDDESGDTADPHDTDRTMGQGQTDAGPGGSDWDTAGNADNDGGTSGDYLGGGESRDTGDDMARSRTDDEERLY